MVVDVGRVHYDTGSDTADVTLSCNAADELVDSNSAIIDVLNPEEGMSHTLRGNDGLRRWVLGMFGRDEISKSYRKLHSPGFSQSC